VPITVNERQEKHTQFNNHSLKYTKPLSTVCNPYFP